MAYIALQGHPDNPLADALFWQTDTTEFVQVLDFEDAAGMKGTTLVTRGDVSLDAEDVRTGGIAMGWDTDIYRTSPKDWLPGEAPGTKKTLLEMVLGVFHAVIKAGTLFENLSPAKQRLFALAMEAAFVGGGYDGGPSDAYHVVDESVYSEKELEKLTEHIYRGDMIVSDDPGTEVLEILEKWGITWSPPHA